MDHSWNLGDLRINIAKKWKACLEGKNSCHGWTKERKAREGIQTKCPPLTNENHTLLSSTILDLMLDIRLMTQNPEDMLTGCIGDYASKDQA